MAFAVASRTFSVLLICIAAFFPCSLQLQNQQPEIFPPYVQRLKSHVPKDSLPCGAHKQLEPNEALIIESPNYSQNRNYPNGLECRWRFLFTRCSLTLSCPSFRLSDILCSDYMEIKDANGKVTRYCGSQGPSNITLKGRAEVSFRTSLFFNSVGFRCQVICIDDGSVNTEGVNVEPTNVAPRVDCACGQALLATKIINGNETQIGEFPWMASLVRTGSINPFCGASIINSRYIMTAAHCASGRTPLNTEIIINEHNIKLEDETPTPTIRRKIDYIISHRSYTSRLDNDIALIRLREPIPLNGSIVPVCLPNKTDAFIGRSATVVGWGLTRENGMQLSDVLLKTDVDVISNERCSQAYPNAVTPRMLCAYKPEHDACQGDSGGPLLIGDQSSYVGAWGYSDLWDENNPQVKQIGVFKYTQVGIVSWGQGCARKDKPGVYARVTEFMPWILRVTADGSYCNA